jgi:hypothetical protein
MPRKEPKGSFVRWQSITIAQLTYSVNLILGLAVAALGFQVALLLNDKFNPIAWQKCAFFVSMFLLVLSIAMGILCVINRLRDFRATTKAARMREERKPGENIQPYRVLYKKLGEKTWSLFWWQIGTFGVGIVFMILGVWASISQKLLVINTTSFAEETVMISPQWISAIGVCVYNALILISLFFLYKQLKVLRNQIRHSTFNSYWAQWIEIDKWFVDHPRLKPYFYHGKVIVPGDTFDDDFRYQLDSAAEMLVDNFASLYFQLDSFVKDEERQVFREFMVRTYREQPFFKDFFDRHSKWYPKGLAALLREEDV